MRTHVSVSVTTPTIESSAPPTDTRTFCETMDSLPKAALAPSLPVIFAASLGLYALGLLVYRLYLHPLAKFPGPKLAAVTSFYEGYFEIVLKGQYSRQISKLHDQYGEYISIIPHNFSIINWRFWRHGLIETGPVVRVTPNEIHIRDSHFFDEFYGRNLHLDKEGWDTRFGTEGGVLTTVNAAFHKRRRAALSPMYVVIFRISRVHRS
jgi:hypothetical protein